MDDYRRANRANWNDRVPIHVGSAEYGFRDFIEDESHISSVVAFDADLVGDVTGKRLLHLQCHFGKDTLSWARLGAEVTGVDFSEPALAAARQLSEESGVPGRFVLSEFYESPRAVDDEFDIVYTGVGAINWLPDIRRWADVVAGFLRPGGTFYMREGHPMMWSLDWCEDLVVRFPYFEAKEPVPWDEDTTYAGDGSLEHTRTYEWNHGLGEIISALLANGLEIAGLREYRTLEWQGLPQMEQRNGLWRLPDDQADLVPLMYSLIAIKS